MKKQRIAKQLVALCTVFAMVFLMSISVIAADGTELVYGQKGTITRAQWLHNLVTVFDMSVEDEELPDFYYQDLTSEKEYYRDMMTAVEFGIIDILSGEYVYPENPVTREFAVSTLNYCLGIKYEGENPAKSFRDYGDIPEDLREDAQIAVDRGWLALQNGAFKPNVNVTSAEVKTMLDDAKVIWNSTDVDENYDNAFTFADGVIVVPETSSVEVGENQVTIYDPDVTIKQDDVFAVYINGLPQVYKALAVEKTDEGLVITTEIPENADALQTVDAEGVQAADLATATAADGFDVTYFTGGTEAKGFTDGVPYKDARLADKKDIRAVTFSGDISIGKGVKVKTSCTLYNTQLEYKVKTLNHEAFATITGDVKVSGTVVGDLNEITGIPTKISLGGINVGGVGYIGIYGKATASGKITVTYQAEYMAGIQHSDRTGTRYIKYFKKTNTGSEADAELGIGVGIEARFDLACVSGRVYAETGMKASYKDKVYNDGKTPNWCATFKAWMYAEAGASLKIDFGISKKSFEKKIVVYDINNSPVRIISHKEDGHRVATCSRDPRDTGFWTNGWYRGIYGGCGGGYGLNDAGEVVPVFTYTTYKNGNNETVAKITGYTGRTHVLVIPDTVEADTGETYKVETIGTGAFAKRADISTVVIPDTVKKIEGNAFGNCPNIQSVKLSSNLQQIDAHAFYNCDNLTSIEIPKSLTTTAQTYIYQYAYGYVWGPFFGCDNLRHVSFEDGTSKVAKGLFANCPGLESITIPDSVKEIEESAFYQCSSLNNIVLGSGVTTLGYTSFAKCDIKELVIPDSVVTIKGGCFANNQNLSMVKLSENLNTMDAHAFYNCDSLTSVKIPKSLKTVNTTYIAEYAYGYVYGPFYGCDGLKDVTFEEGMIRIPQGLFANCPGLEEISMPDSVQKIGNQAFDSCISLKNVSIGKGVTILETKAFAECESIEKIEIPDNVLTIEAGCFANCTKLSEVRLSENLDTMNTHAFYNCDKLTSIKIPKSLKTGENAYLNEYAYGYVYGPFYGCDGLKTVAFETGCQRIVQGLFANCPGLNEITIPDTVTQIDNYAFEHSPNLKKVILPKGMKTIGMHAFNACSALTEIDFSNTDVSEIGMYCFNNCTSLQTVKLPKNYKIIRANLFDHCSKLESIELSESIERIESSAFARSGLKNIVIPANVKNIDQQAFQQSKLENVTIKDAVVSIGNRAFDECVDLVQVELGKNVTSIEYNAFRNCDRLESITIPGSVTSLNTGIFESCDLLKEIKLGTGITVIPEKMCYECGNLEKIVLPYGITKIRKLAFANCAKLSEVTIPRNTTAIEDDAFSYPSKMTIYGVAGSFAETYANQKGIRFVRNSATATEVKLDDTELSLKNGESRKLAFSATPENFSDDVIWRTTDAKVVSVDKNGVIKALSVGNAIVQVNVGNVSAKCKITVVQPVTRIYLNKTNAELEATKTLQLTADVRPDMADNKEVTWTSSVPEVATVSETGLVTALKKGKTTITAASQDGSNITATCQITVKNNVYIVTDPMQMESAHPYENNCKDIWIYTLPSETDNLLVTFDGQTSIEEDFDDVLYIYDENDNQIGQYKGAQLAGKTIIVPGKTVKIKLDTDATGTDWGFKVTSIKGDDDIVEKEDQILEGTYSYAKAFGNADFALDMHLTKGDGTLSYSSDNGNVATVSDKGVVSIKGVGTANLTITAAGTRYYNEAVAEVELTVEKGTRNFNPSVTRTLQVGKTAQIQAETDGKVTYHTEDTEVISVSDMGIVTALAEGEAMITVSLEEDEHYFGADIELQITVVGEEVKAATELSACTITVLDAENLYADGSSKQPKVEVSYEDNIFIEGNDYALSYKNNVQAGTAVIVVSALPEGSLAGSVEVSFTIKANIAGNEVEIKDNAFEGSHNLKVTFGNNLTKIGKQAFKNAEVKEIYFKGNAPDISADAFENVIATVYVPRDNQSWTETKRQNYGGALTWKFWNPSTGVTCENLEDGDAVVNDLCVYDGIAKTPYVTVRFGNATLTQGVDFTVEYSNNVNAGTATAVITGIGRYAGTLTCTFIIDKAQADLEFANIWQYCKVGDQFTNPLNIRRTGSEITYRSSDDSIASVDPSTGLVTAKRVGTVEITASAAEGSNVYGGEDFFMLEVSYTQNNIQASDVEKSYSKKAQSFNLSVSANGAPLSFTSNNKKISVDKKGRVTVAKGYTGKAVITIKSSATEKYEAASKSITVSVNPTGTSISSCKNIKGKKAQISWKKNKLATGYEIQYSTDKNFAKGVKKKTVKKASVTKITLTKLKKKQTYYVRIRTYRKNGGTTYSSWSKVKKVVIKK